MNIIAEIGTSHEGSVRHAFSLIDAAKDAGADTVKFQWVYADEILHPDTGFVNLPGGKIPLYDRYKALEVPDDFFTQCLEYCRKREIKFACSPFGIKSLKKLAQLNPDYIKIASPELNHIPFLEEVSKYINKIPVIISSGVSKLSDIELAVNTLTGNGSVSLEKNMLTLLHCSTFYPTPEEEYNVSVIKNLSNIFGLPCGISDHSLDPVLVPVLSCAFGGTCIEKHITLSNETDGLDDPVALTPQKFAMMVHEVTQAGAVIERFNKSIIAEQLGKKSGIKTLLPQEMSPCKEAAEYIIRQMENQYGKEKVQKTIGSGIKKLSQSEEQNYGRTNRSIHFINSMKKGQIITENDIAVLRTEKNLTPGIEPKFYRTVLGAKLTKDAAAGEGLTFEHLLST